MIDCDNISEILIDLYNKAVLYCKSTDLEEKHKKRITQDILPLKSLNLLFMPYKKIPFPKIVGVVNKIIKDYEKLNEANKGSFAGHVFHDLGNEYKALLSDIKPQKE